MVTSRARHPAGRSIHGAGSVTRASVHSPGHTGARGAERAPPAEPGRMPGESNIAAQLTLDALDAGATASWTTSRLSATHQGARRHLLLPRARRVCAPEHGFGCIVWGRGA